MAKPKNRSDAGFGVLRRTNANEKTICLVNTENGWCHKAYSTVAQSKGISGKYYVFRMPEGAENKAGKTYSFTGGASVKAFGYDDFVEAQEKYIDLCLSECSIERQLWGIGEGASLTINNSVYD